MGRIDQEAARQERHHGQHLQIDPIGAREAVAAAGLALAGDDLGVRRQEPADSRLHLVTRGAGDEAQIDPLQPPELAEPPLGRGDVDHADALILADVGQHAGNTERRAVAGGEELDPVAWPPAQASQGGG